MSSPFPTEPVAIWEYLSLAHRHKSTANTTTKHSHTPNSSQTVTAMNGTEPSWELQILLQPKPVDKCYNITSIIHSHRHQILYKTKCRKKFLHDQNDLCKCFITFFFNRCVLRRSCGASSQSLTSHFWSPKFAFLSLQALACVPVMQRARVRSPVGTSFLGEVFLGFFLTCKSNVRKLQAHKVPEYHLAIIIIITHHSLRVTIT